MRDTGKTNRAVVARVTALRLLPTYNIIHMPSRAEATLAVRCALRHGTTATRARARHAMTAELELLGQIEIVRARRARAWKA